MYARVCGGGKWITDGEGGTPRESPPKDVESCAAKAVNTCGGRTIGGRWVKKEDKKKEGMVKLTLKKRRGKRKRKINSFVSSVHHATERGPHSVRDNS